MVRQPTSRAFRLRSQVLSTLLLWVAALTAVWVPAGCSLVQQTAAPRPEGSRPRGLPADVAISILPPEAGAPYLKVNVIDAAGAPVTDAQVSLEGNMNHAGMAPVVSDPVFDDADGAADGVYQVPFEFTMLGDWIITVSVETADGKAAGAEVDVSVREAGAQLAGVAEGAAAGGLQISDVRARPVPMPGGNTAIFLTITNAGAEADRLVNALSDAAEIVELHETVKEGDVMRMVHMPEGFEIPTGGSIELKPGGKHVMLMGVTAPMAVGDEVQIELVFEKSEPVTLTVPVVEMSTNMP